MVRDHPKRRRTFMMRRSEERVKSGEKKPMAARLPASPSVG
jgi:hypothetical protein